MLLELGANDFLLGIPPEECKKNLSTIIESIQSKGVSVALLDFSNDQMIAAASDINKIRLMSYKKMFTELAEIATLP